MNKLNEIISLYKTNRKLFNIIVLTVNVVLIVWQAIFALVMPSRGNVILLIILIGALVFQLFRDS